MGELRLYAIGIDEVRDMFAAAPDEAARLREIAGRRFARPQPAPKHGLLSKVGPLFRRPLIDAPGPMPHDAPTKDDIEMLVAGHFVPPERLTPAWLLLEGWIDERAWSCYRWSTARGDIADFDFALARAGGPAQLGVQRLLDGEAGIALRPYPGPQVGYAKHPHADAMASALAGLTRTIEPQHAERLGSLSGWLGQFTGWAVAAPEAGRPAPDLLALFS